MDSKLKIGLSPLPRCHNFFGSPWWGGREKNQEQSSG